MVNYEDVPSGHWMIVNNENGDILYHAKELDKVLEETRKDEYEDDNYHLTQKIDDVIALRGK